MNYTNETIWEPVRISRHVTDFTKERGLLDAALKSPGIGVKVNLNSDNEADYLTDRLRACTKKIGQNERFKIQKRGSAVQVIVVERNN